MAVHVSWYAENQIVIECFSGHVTIEDVARADLLAQRLIDEGQHPVNVIIDLRGVQHFPTNIRKISQQFSRGTHSGMGWVVVVTNHGMIQFVVRLVTEFVGTHAPMFTTIDEALAYLLAMDVRLVESLALEKAG